MFLSGILLTIWDTGVRMYRWSLLNEIDATTILLDVKKHKTVEQMFNNQMKSFWK